MRVLALLVAFVAPALAQDGSPPEDPGFRQPATIRGRFLLDDGTPAADVTLHLHGWWVVGRPGNWSDLRAATNEEGQFELRFVPSRAYSFSLRASRPGFAGAFWSWDGIEMGEEVDLGDVTCAPAGTVIGTVVDARGNVLTRAWSGYAVPADAAMRRTLSYLSGAVDSQSGEFRLEGVPPGKALVGARGLGVTTETVEVEVVAGVETVVELVYTGPDLARRIGVRPRSTFGLHPGLRSVRLVAPDGTIRTPSPTEGSSSVFVFDEVPESEYRLEIDDPLFELWSREGVRPGDQVDAHLHGAGRIALEVADAATGRPISSYGLGVLLDVGGRLREFEVMPTGTPVPADGIIDDLLPQAQTLVVHVEGRAPQRVDVPQSSRGELRSVRVEVGARRTRFGRVVQADGAPAPRAIVEWTAGGTAGSYRVNGVLRPAVVHAYRTDREGRFRIPTLEAGLYTVRARWGPHVYADVHVELPLVDPAEPTFVLPPSGRLAGVLRLPPGADTATLALRFPTMPSCSTQASTSVTEGLLGGIDAAGRFDVGPLVVGTWPVELLLVVGSRRGGGATYHSIAVGEVEIRPGETTTAPTWDVTDEYPGILRARVHTNGIPLAGANLYFEEVGGPALVGGLPETNEDGEHPGEILTPGKWTVVVSGEGSLPWVWTSPEPVVVASGEELVLELDVPVVRRTLLVLDGDTERPLADHEVLGWPAHDRLSVGYGRARTDAEGRMTLALAPGALRLARGPRYRIPSGKREDGENRLMVRIEWVAGNDELVVRLPAHED